MFFLSYFSSVRVVLFRVLLLCILTRNTRVIHTQKSREREIKGKKCFVVAILRLLWVRALAPVCVRLREKQNRI